MRVTLDGTPKEIREFFSTGRMPEQKNTDIRRKRKLPSRPTRLSDFGDFIRVETAKGTSIVQIWKTVNENLKKAGIKKVVRRSVDLYAKGRTQNQEWKKLARANGFKGRFPRMCPKHGLKDLKEARRILRGGK